MKKTISLISLLLGAFFLAGCGQQQPSQAQSTMPVPVAQNPATNQPPATDAEQNSAIQTQPTPTPSKNPVTMQSLLGMWAASDGTTKAFNSNGTSSVGLGDGPQNFTLSSGADSNGRYTLLIARPFDQINLSVKDDGGGQMSVFDENGKLLWTMTKK